MHDLIATVDWSRAQFALTAMYHWLFVPLTIGLALIVAIMESIYVRTGEERWKGITKFWMTLFGINFACGIATGIILEFEFGTNWSNYSWFVGDIFGAPLAIEGLFAFFLEATFVAVMFFGWKRVSKRFHLTATWLTALGVTLSAYWILVANAWMQYPAGMEFDPAQMRNVMDDFWAVAFSPVAVNKFFHAVFSGWALAAAFVAGVSCWMILKKRNLPAALSSLKIAVWVGLAGILLTMYTGHGSAVQVARHQPMKLAAMEGLYDGSKGQELVGFGFLADKQHREDSTEPIKCKIAIPYGLSFLANNDIHSFVPGINDIINGVSVNATGDTINTVSYDERIARGRAAREALIAYDNASKAGDTVAMNAATKAIKADFKYFGYASFESPDEAIPNVPLTFYSFRVMVIFGGFLLLVLVVMAFFMWKKPAMLRKSWLAWGGILMIPAAWFCSQAGWVVAEVGRQPWVIQDLMSTRIGVSDISSASVQTTFWIFAVFFTLLLIAEISILCRQISKSSRGDIENPEKA